MQYTGEVISGIFLLMVTLIEVRAIRDRKRSEVEKERVEKRAELRAKESKLAMQMQEAALKLSLVTAKKVMNMHTNGDVKDAFDAAERAGAEYTSFIEGVAAKTITKN